MDSKLLCKIVQGVEGVAGVKPLLILAVAAFDLPIMARCVRANEFQFGLRVLVWMTVGRLDWQVRDATLPSQRCFQK